MRNGAAAKEQWRSIMGIRITSCLVWIFILCSHCSARDYFTEQFSGDFDIAFTTFTFKPDRSSNGYAVCRSPATEFPTPPTNGSMIFTYPASVAFDPAVPFYGQFIATLSCRRTAR
jgi:hypothetical protein